MLLYLLDGSFACLVCFIGFGFGCFVVWFSVYYFERCFALFDCLLIDVCGLLFVFN